MFVPQKALKGRLLTTALQRRGMERKWRCLAEEEAQEGTERAINAYGVPLSHFTSFKYLGEPVVGAATLLQYHNCIPKLEVHKVNPEVSPD